MSSSFYRVYIRFGKNNCVRFFASGDGIVAKDGLQLFEWIRDPGNITRLRNGLQHVYEIDEFELPHFLQFKLQEDHKYREEQMSEYSAGGDMFMAFKQKHVDFNSLETGIEKLEAISNATQLTVIPRAYPRKRLDQPGWLYLLNLDRETLEVYEFKDYKLDLDSPFARLSVECLYEASPEGPPGYYVKLQLSELQAIWRNEWIMLHKTHAEALAQLWKQNSLLLQTVPHADSIPFAVLYGSVFDGQDGNRASTRRSGRLTQARLTKVLATLNRRKPSNMSIFDKHNQHRRVKDRDDRRLEQHMRLLGPQEGTGLERQRGRLRKR